MNNETKFIIYALDKEKWYRADCNGYTEKKGEAGQYTAEELVHALDFQDAEGDHIPELSVMLAPGQRRRRGIVSSTTYVGEGEELTAIVELA